MRGAKQLEVLASLNRRPSTFTGPKKKKPKPKPYCKERYGKLRAVFSAILRMA